MKKRILSILLTIIITLTFIFTLFTNKVYAILPELYISSSNYSKSDYVDYSQEEHNLGVGKTIQLYAMYIYGGAGLEEPGTIGGQYVTYKVTDGATWTSQNTSIATVDSNTGLVTGVSIGTTTITVTHDGATYNYEINVVDVFFKIEKMNAQKDETIIVKVDMDCATGFIAANFEINYDSTVLEYMPYLDANNKVVYTENYGETIASIGRIAINGSSAGLIRIGYMSDDEESIVGKKGEFLKLRFKVLNNAAYGDSEITMTSTTLKESNRDDLTPAFISGTVSIISSLHFELNSIEMQESEFSNNYVYTEDGSIFDPVVWTSSNESVATVAKDGPNEQARITAIAPGTATITATVGGLSATCNVTVVAADVPEEYTISINEPAWGFLPPIQKRALNVTFNPASQAEGKTVTWSSANTNVATIDSSTGVITAVGAGTTVITATVGDKSSTYTLTVSGMLGDIDNDSNITAYDAYRALVLAANQNSDSGVYADEVVILDVERDGSMSSGDAYEILKYSVGLINSFIKNNEG